MDLSPSSVTQVLPLIAPESMPDKVRVALALVVLVHNDQVASGHGLVSPEQEQALRKMAQSIVQQGNQRALFDELLKESSNKVIPPLAYRLVVSTFCQHFVLLHVH